jgi:thioester reductase-like protein
LMGDRRSPLLSGLIVPQGATVNSDLLRRIKEAKPDERQGLIVTFLQGELQAVLGLASPPDPMTGFFDLGMDSLMALEFGTRLANAFGNEVALPPTLAFDYPSLDKLAGYLTDNLSPDRNTAEQRAATSQRADNLGPEEREDIEKAASRARSDFDPIISLNAHMAEEYIPDASRVVLLTGAGGFLGGFLLREVLARVDKVYCLMRCKNEEEGFAILRGRLAKARLDFPLDRVEIIPGDLLRENLDLPADVLERMSLEVDTILHCGSLVHHLHRFAALEQTNVNGTLELIKLAVTKKKKKFIYVSTMGVPWAFGDGAVPGDEISTHRFAVSNGYVLTKWVAEQLVYKYSQEFVFPSVIVRPGNITGSTDSGYCNYGSNQFWSWVIGCIQLGSYPKLDVQMEMVPVDQLAAAIAALSVSSDLEVQVANLSNPELLSAQRLFELFRESGLSVKGESPENWGQKLLEIDESNAINMFKDFDVGRLAGVSLAIEQSATFEVLRKLGVVYSIDYGKIVPTYVRYMRESGFV